MIACVQFGSHATLPMWSLTFNNEVQTSAFLSRPLCDLHSLEKVNVRWILLLHVTVIFMIQKVDTITDIRGRKRDWKCPYNIYSKPAFNPHHYCIGISVHVCGVFVWCLCLVSEFHYSWHIQSHQEDVMEGIAGS